MLSDNQFTLTSCDPEREALNVFRKCGLRYEPKIENTDVWKATIKFLEFRCPPLRVELTQSLEVLRRHGSPMAGPLPFNSFSSVCQHVIHFLEAQDYHERQKFFSGKGIKGKILQSYLQTTFNLSVSKTRRVLNMMLSPDWGLVYCVDQPGNNASFSGGVPMVVSFDETKTYTLVKSATTAHGLATTPSGGSGLTNNKTTNNASSQAFPPLSPQEFVANLQRSVIIFETVPAEESHDMADSILFLYPRKLRDDPETYRKLITFIGAFFTLGPVVEQLTGIGSCPKSMDDPAVVYTDLATMVVRQIATKTCFMVPKKSSNDEEEGLRRLYLIVGGSPRISEHNHRLRAQVIYKSLLFNNGPIDTLVEHMESHAYQQHEAAVNAIVSETKPESETEEQFAKTTKSKRKAAFQAANNDLLELFRGFVVDMMKESMAYVTGGTLWSETNGNSGCTPKSSSAPSLGSAPSMGYFTGTDRYAYTYPFHMHLNVLQLSMSATLFASRLISDVLNVDRHYVMGAGLFRTNEIVSLTNGKDIVADPKGYEVVLSSLPPECTHFLLSRIHQLKDTQPFGMGSPTTPVTPDLDIAFQGATCFSLCNVQGARWGKYASSQTFVLDGQTCTLNAFAVFMTKAQLTAARLARGKWAEDLDTSATRLGDVFDLEGPVVQVTAEEACEAEHILSALRVDRNNVVTRQENLWDMITALKEGKTELEDGTPVPTEDAYTSPYKQATIFEGALKTLVAYNHCMQKASETSAPVDSPHGAHLFSRNRHVSGKYVGVLVLGMGLNSLAVVVPISALDSIANQQRHFDQFVLRHIPMLQEFSLAVRICLQPNCPPGNGSGSTTNTPTLSQANSNSNSSNTPQPPPTSSKHLRRMDHAMMNVFDEVPLSANADACVTNGTTLTTTGYLTGREDFAFLEQATFASAYLHRTEERERRILPMPCLHPETLASAPPYPISAMRIALRHATGKTALYGRSFRRLSWYYKGYPERTGRMSVGPNSSGSGSNALPPLSSVEASAFDFFDKELKLPIL